MNQIVLFLLSYKGYSVLNEIIKIGFGDTIALVVVGRDKNTINDYSKEIIELCETNHIKWLERRDLTLEEIDKYKYAIAISWRWLIHLKKTQLFVVHDSLLPKYRGFAPLVNQLINKEPIIGVTLLSAAEEYDTGDIINQSQIQINYPIKIEQAIKDITKCYIEVSVGLFTTIREGKKIKSYVQDEKAATYSLWRDNQDYMIDWSKDAGYIERFINAIGYPYTSAKTYLNDKIITIEGAKEIDDVKIMNRDIGKVIFFVKGNPVVVCGKGLLMITNAYGENGTSVIPLKKFRSRFQSYNLPK